MRRLYTCNRLGCAAVVAVLLLGCVTPMMAAEPGHNKVYGTMDHTSMDIDARLQPWSNCAGCHDVNGDGGFAPSCVNCHNDDFADPDPPPRGHNYLYGNMDHAGFDIDDRLDPTPQTSCAGCHGNDLTGGWTNVSCFTCHDQMWPDPGGNGGNSPPVVDVGGPYSGQPGVPVLFDASGTEPDPDGDDLTYLWLFNDGKPPSGIRQVPTLSHTFDEPGTYIGMLTVADPTHTVGPVQFDVVIGGNGNQTPTADVGGPYSGTVDQAVNFSGSGSTDDGTITTYEWDFGDGGTGTGMNATHTYTAADTYTVRLTVTDNDGATNYEETTAVISAAGNLPPDADPGEPYSGVVGQAVAFDGSGSMDDSAIVSYEWTFGDGGTGTGMNVTHTYTAADTYTVRLTVTDDDGATDYEETTAVITDGGGGGGLPVADPGGPYTGVVGQPVQFDGTGSSDPGGAIFAYLWDFGDEGIGISPTPTHVYASPGTYTVELTVADQDFNMATATTTVEITSSTPGPGPGDGEGDWSVRIPLLGDEFALNLEDFGGFLLVEEIFPDGKVLTGIGMEAGTSIIWIDTEGAIFFGSMNRRAGTMQGLVFDYFGRDSIWMAEQPRGPGDCGGSNGGLFGMGLFGFGMAGGSTSMTMGPQSMLGGSPMGTQTSRTNSPATMGPRSGFGARSTPRTTMLNGTRGTVYRHPRGGMRGGTTRYGQSSSYHRFPR